MWALTVTEEIHSEGVPLLRDRSCRFRRTMQLDGVDIVNLDC